MAEEQPNRKGENLVLFNPFRVVPAQERGIDFFRVGDAQPVKGGNPGERANTRYSVLIPHRRSGWLILNDHSPNEPEDLLDFDEQQAPVVAPEQPPPTSTVTPPEEFECTEQ